MDAHALSVLAVIVHANDVRRRFPQRHVERPLAGTIFGPLYVRRFLRVAVQRNKVLEKGLTAGFWHLKHEDVCQHAFVCC